MAKRMFAHRVQLYRIEHTIALHTFNGEYERAQALRDFFSNEPIDDASIANEVARMRRYEAEFDALDGSIGK